MQSPLIYNRRLGRYDARMILPYVTQALPGVGGAIKLRPEDFFVEEIPLYEAQGTGEHVYCQIEKTGLTTFEAVRRIGEALGLQRQDIGYAGMKDARAVTRQTLSLLGTTEEKVQALAIPGITIQWVKRHNNKLRLGHLAGNRFAIRVRDVDPAHVVRAKAICDVLVRRGVPNFFGEQRFGMRHNNDQLGAALIRDDAMTLLKLLLGSPDSRFDDGQTIQARRHFEAHENELAMKHWPRRCGLERRVLARLINSHRPSAAIRLIDEPLRRLWVSSLQSRIFNEVLARRIDTYDQILPGDFACKHENGACFLVEDAQAEQPRCQAFEISATGPLVGYRMSTPELEPLQIEQDVLAEHQLTPAQFREPGKHKVKGSRRPLRIKLQDLAIEGGADDFGPHITVAFTLPSGSFATVILREIMKNEAVETEPAATPAADAAD